METVRAYDLNGKLPPVLLTILARESVLAESYVVGGFVRDAIWGEVSKDIDIEVFGVDWAALAEALAGWGKVDRVGESFGTVKLTLPGGGAIDFSLPREEVKTGPGHRGFTVGIRSDLSRAQAADRRDFTINALYYDPRRRHVVDCVGGLENLERKRLRPVNRKTFSDDPLRLLRAMQFVSRFELQADAVLADLGREKLSEYEKLAGREFGRNGINGPRKAAVPLPDCNCCGVAAGWSIFRNWRRWSGCRRIPNGIPKATSFVMCVLAATLWRSWTIGAGNRPGIALSTCWPSCSTIWGKPSLR